MKNIKNLRIGFHVYDKLNSCWNKIGNSDDLDFVTNNWETRFIGIPLTLDNIIELFSDINAVPSFCNHSTIKYSIYNEYNIKPVAVLYGVMDTKDGPYFFKRRMCGEDFIGSFSNGTDPFDDFYCVKNKKKIHIKYVHELYNFINSLKYFDIEYPIFIL